MTQADVSTIKPRIALAGEFSAGKSTLCNFLLGQAVLPEKVTATQLPPVWMSWGNADPVRVGHDGSEYPISLERLEDLPFDETKFIRVQLQADILKTCDLIDLPGISDPNMASEVWENMISEVNGILWCTHATQSWRQSEAGVWSQMEESLRRNSLLLVTKFDKISEKNQPRIIKRLQHEAGSEFASICPLSIVQLDADETGVSQWKTSGTDKFFAKLGEITQRISGVSYAPAAAVVDPSLAGSHSAGHASADGQASGNAETGRIMPRRVRPQRVGSSMQRPTRRNSA